MQSVSLNEQQATELCDSIGKMIVEQLNSESMQSNINQVINDYINRNNIQTKLEDLSNKIQVSVKVQLMK